MERNKALDICKGIGILLVIIGHMSTPLGQVIYGFHMGLFFFLSGYLFNNNYLDDGLSFLKKRAVRLLVPYLLFPLLAFLLFPHIDEVWYKIWSSSKLMASYPYHILGTMWFLKSLFFVNVLSLLVIKLFRLIKGRLTLMLPLMMLIAYYIILCFTGQLSGNVIYYSAFYLMGYHCKYIKFDLFRPYQINSCILLSWGGAFLVLVMASYYTRTVISNTDCHDFLPYYIGSMCGIYLTCQLSSLTNQDSVFGRVMILLGQKTLPIMIFNWAAFGLLDVILMTIGIKLPPGIIYWTAQISIAVVIPISVDSLYTSAKSIFIQKFTSK